MLRVSFSLRMYLDCQPNKPIADGRKSLLACVWLNLKHEKGTKLMAALSMYHFVSLAKRAIERGESGEHWGRNRKKAWR